MRKILHKIRTAFPRFYHLYSYLRLRNKTRGKLIFRYSCKITDDSSFEGANKILDRTIFRGRLGYGSYIMKDSCVEAYIGRFTSIAPRFITNKGMHPYKSPYVSTCPMFYSLKEQNGYTFAKHQAFEEERPFAVIGNDCWIGENVFMVGGVKVGDGAVVLSGAVVTKDIEPYSIVGGVPAKQVGYRYDAKTIQFLLEICWWNQPLSWLEEHWQLFNNIEELKDYYGRHPEEFEQIKH